MSDSSAAPEVERDEAAERVPAAGRRPVLSLGVAGRLAVLLGGVAAASTGIALLTQDRALDQDLRTAAVARLERSASVADRLVADHLRAIATRYAAISRTPELRANLESRHAETLSYYAARLLRDQGATLVAFVGRDGEFLATAGDPRLVGAAHARTLDRASGTAACVPASTPETRGAANRWVPCAYPEGFGDGTLFESGGDVYALAAVPLRTEGRTEGGLIVVEAVDAAVLAGWSELSGATIRTGATTPDALDAPVRALPGLELRVSTTYEAEQAIIQRARNNLVVSGLLALLLAVVASLLLARAFTRPILRMREATERLSEGDLDHRVEVERDDELGKLGLAFNELASRLTDSQERVRRAQRFARFGNWYFDPERKTFDGTSEFRRLMRLPEVGSVLLDAVLSRVSATDRDELYFMIDPKLHWKLRPNTEVKFLDTLVTTNEYGFRSEPVDDPEGGILFLGDSTPFGWKVQQSECFPSQIARSTLEKGHV